MIGLITLIKTGHLPNALTDLQASNLLNLRITKGWWFSNYSILDSAWFGGVLYATFMIVVGIPFLSGMGASANSKREAVWGGISGGIFLMLPIILIVLAMLCYPDQITMLEVPLLYIADQNAPVLAVIFSIILLLGVYSTGAPMFWMIMDWIEGFISSKKIMFLVF